MTNTCEVFEEIFERMFIILLPFHGQSLYCLRTLNNAFRSFTVLMTKRPVVLAAVMTQDLPP